MEMEARNKCSRRKSAAAAAAAKGLGPGPTAGGQDPPLSGADLISDLPDAVLGDIISLLRVKEGARTQVLASRWRHLWRSAPLNLHYRPFLFSREGLDVTISRVLAAHSGPGRRFCAPVYHLSSGRAESWLQSPALDNLQELELCSYDCNLWLPLTMLKPPPPAAFRFSNTLCVATIGNCHLSDDTVQGLHFPMLQKLALTWVSISESALHAMIDGCPIMQSLLIQNSSGFCCVRINSISIRKIGVKTFVGHRELPFGELIIENAPCLESLLQLGSNDGLHVSVISAPKLEALGHLSSSAYSARISFDSTVIQGLHVDSLTSVVCTIKILAIDMHALTLDDVLHLMRCFPCLEKLYIQSTGPGKTNVWRRKHRTLVRSLDIRLKTIAWQYYRGIKSHIDFATFFVRNAGVLELMTFGVNRKDYNEAFFAQQREMLDVDRRASRGARLRFTSEWSYNYIRGSSVHDLDPADPFERTHPLKGDTSFVLC